MIGWYCKDCSIKSPSHPLSANKWLPIKKIVATILYAIRSPAWSHLALFKSIFSILSPSIQAQHINDVWVSLVLKTSRNKVVQWLRISLNSYGINIMEYTHAGYLLQCRPCKIHLVAYQYWELDWMESFMLGKGSTKVSPIGHHMAVYIMALRSRV